MRRVGVGSQKKVDPETLKTKNAALKKENENLRAENAALKEANEALKAENAELLNKIPDAPSKDTEADPDGNQEKKSGRKSKKTATDPDNE